MSRSLAKKLVSQRQWAQSNHESSALSGEVILRYLCATAATLVALFGAQLVVRNDFIIALSVITVLGTPVSIALRMAKMRIGRLQIPRPVWNSLIVLMTLGAAAFYLAWVLRDFLSNWNGSSQGFWIRFGAGDSMIILIQVFLIFAAFRAFALITDKDCTLATVPSFSVLLLLIPVHKGIEVVGYFLAWTCVAALLFALDHRAEQRSYVVAVVPARSPGADSKMAARNLGAILGFSLCAAIAISAFITSRNPEDRSEAETAISSLAGRLTQLALSLPEGSVNGGPERQIDFSSGPSLPSRAILWQFGAVTLDGEVVRSEYLRLFTLSNYNGSSWSQAQGGQKPVRKKTLLRSQWPLPRITNMGQGGGDQNRFTPNGGGGRPDFTFNPNGGGRERRPQRGDGGPNGGPGGGPRGDGRGGGQRGEGPPQANRQRSEGQFRFGVGRLDMRRELPPGFPISEKQPGLRGDFGGNDVPVRQLVTARAANLGFVPLLPAPQSIRLPNSDQKEVRARSDGAIDVGVVQTGETVRAFSYVPRVKEYGFKNGSAPDKKVASTQKSPQLSDEERKRNLALPPSITPRLRTLARSYVRNAKTDESSYSMAQRLALGIQENSVYTLRPPAIPSDREAADYFLFEGNRRGYCTYFAGALTVLCRLNGIPARVVSGFASAEYDGESFGIIREANAHAWTEVWVENWGWAVVDATPSADIGDNAPTWIENWADLFGATLDSALRWSREHIPVIFLTIAALVAIFLAIRWRRNLWKILRPIQAIEKENEHSRREISQLYLQTTKFLASQFRPRSAWETPDEWLGAAVRALPQIPREPLETLTSLYLRANFSPAPLDTSNVQQAQLAANTLKQKRSFKANKRDEARS